MELQNQICSLELAKKLKELGVKQESIFYWSNLDNGDYKLWVNMISPSMTVDNGLLSQNLISAFTVAELGEILKKEVDNYTFDVFSMPCVEGFEKGKWMANYSFCTLKDFINIEDVEYAETEVDARAKLLICLLENNLINPEQK